MTIEEFKEFSPFYTDFGKNIHNYICGLRQHTSVIGISFSSF